MPDARFQSPSSAPRKPVDMGSLRVRRCNISSRLVGDPIWRSAQLHWTGGPQDQPAPPGPRTGARSERCGRGMRGGAERPAWNRRRSAAPDTGGRSPAHGGPGWRRVDPRRPPSRGDGCSVSERTGASPSTIGASSTRTQPVSARTRLMDGPSRSVPRAEPSARPGTFDLGAGRDLAARGGHVLRFDDGRYAIDDAGRLGAEPYDVGTVKLGPSVGHAHVPERRGIAPVRRGSQDGLDERRAGRARPSLGRLRGCLRPRGRAGHGLGSPFPVDVLARAPLTRSSSVRGAALGSSEHDPEDQAPHHALVPVNTA